VAESRSVNAPPDWAERTNWRRHQAWFSIIPELSTARLGDEMRLREREQEDQLRASRIAGERVSLDETLRKKKRSEICVIGSGRYNSSNRYEKSAGVLGCRY